MCFGGNAQGDPLWNGKGPEAAGRRKKTGRHLPMEEMSMYQKKAFNRREQDYAMGLRRKPESSRAIRLRRGIRALTLTMLWRQMWMGSRCGQYGPGISRLMG